MVTCGTRALKQRWEDALKHVRTYGGDVPRFFDLLTQGGYDRIFSEKEHTRSLPPDTVMYFGYSGENKAAFEYKNPYNGELTLYPAVDFDNFDTMLVLLEQKLQHRRISHCMYGSATPSAADIVDEWSVDAVQEAMYKSRIYWNILVDSFQFGQVDEALKPHLRFFKNKSTMPSSYAEAFPNLNALKLQQRQQEAAKTPEIGEVSCDPYTPHTPDATTGYDHNFVCPYASTGDLSRIAVTMSLSKQAIYNKSETIRMKRRRNFDEWELVGPQNTVGEIIDCLDSERRRQLKQLLE
jgi:hypothetical protein